MAPGRDLLAASAVVQYSHLLTPLQVSVDELLRMAASLEACSEHPLAAAVLQFAAAHLAPGRDNFSADLAAGLQELEDTNESSGLLSSPVKGHQQPASPTNRDWLQTATDVEVVEGMCCNDMSSKTRTVLTSHCRS